MPRLNVPEAIAQHRAIQPATDAYNALVAEQSQAQAEVGAAKRALPLAREADKRAYATALAADAKSKDPGEKETDTAQRAIHHAVHDGESHGRVVAQLPQRQQLHRQGRLRPHPRPPPAPHRPDCSEHARGCRGPTRVAQATQATRYAGGRRGVQRRVPRRGADGVAVSGRVAEKHEFGPLGR